MPLRDHFHPPVSNRRAWDELHGGWPMMIVLQLQGILPPDYTAGPQIHLGGAVEIGVGAYEQQGNGDGAAAQSNGNGGVATSAWTTTEPTLRVETDLLDLDEYEVRVYDLTRARRLVAAIELVSPSNKDRPETRRAFVTKCAALLQQQVSVTIVDVVTTREANLYAELLEFLNQKDAALAAPRTTLYAVACRETLPKNRYWLETWHRPLVVGQPLPSLPLWLGDDRVVTLDLEASYEATCQGLRIA